MVVDHYAIRNDEKTLNWVGGIAILLGISVKCIDCAGEPDRFSIPEAEVYALEGSEMSIFEDPSNQQPKSGQYKLSTLEGTLAVDYKKCGTKDDARLTITTDENHERYWAILRATDYTIVKTSDSSKFLHNLNSTNFNYLIILI